MVWLTGHVQCEAQYRQDFQHNKENVSQKPLTRMVLL
jgi:hypothetical protein